MSQHARCFELKVYCSCPLAMPGAFFYIYVLPDFFCIQFVVFHIQVLSAFVKHFRFTAVVLDETWSGWVDIFSFCWRKPEDLIKRKNQNLYEMSCSEITQSGGISFQLTRLGSMPECKMVSTISIVSFSWSGLYMSKITEMLCCCARLRSWSKEGMDWFLAVSLSSSDSWDTEWKGSVWKGQ